MIKKSIVFKTSIALLLFFLLFICTYSLVNLAFVQDSLKNAQQEKAETIAKAVLPGIALNISFGFEDALNETLSSLTKSNEFIIASQIISPEGHMLFSYDNAHELSLEEKKLYFESEVRDVNTDMLLGKLIMFYSNKQYEAMLEDYVILSAMITLLSFAALTMFVFYFYRSLKPLRRLATQLYRYDPKSASQIPLDIKKSHDEVGTISKAAHSMLKKIEEYSSSLEEMNKNLQKKVEEEVKKNREKDQILIRQSRLVEMGEMLTMIAHHWRQPLNQIGITVQNLQDDFHYGEMDENNMQIATEKIMMILKNISGTINHFSGVMTQVEQKRFFDPFSELENLLKLFTPEFKTNYIDIQLIPPESDLTLFGDRAQFKEVMMSLIKNAEEALVVTEKKEFREIIIKFSQQGGIMEIKVWDNGDTIPEELLPRIFEPFFTTKGITSKTGLGLYSAKLIVERHFGGSIQAINQESGVEFLVKLPLKGEKP